MNRNETWRAAVIALLGAAGLMGCENNDAAVKALQELTTELSKQVEAKNEELSSLATEVETCVKGLAEVTGEAADAPSTSSDVSVPSLDGAPTVESLEALKKALNEAGDAQKVAFQDLQDAKARCDKDLETAKAEAEAAAAEAAEAAAEEAAAEAAAAEAAARKAAARKKRRPQKKSTMVEQREAEGRPTTGTGSRYEKR